MNEIPPVMDENDQQEQGTWYSIPLNKQCELSKKGQLILNKYFKNKTVSKGVVAYIGEEDGRPTLYLKNTPHGLAMAIEAVRCKVPKCRLSRYKGHSR